MPRKLIKPRYPSSDYGYEDSPYRTVQDIAWELVMQPFALEAEAQQVVVQSLESDKAIICASAALLLQYSKSLLPETQVVATKKILQILANPVLSRRPLEPPDQLDWQLDNILFETLQVLAEQAR